jgi:crotonobetainyl-CoA:carnitine CoA-transferase CaiB-like acyl-CoA transferase
MIPAAALQRKTGESLDLLAGVRVLDLTTSVAGPAGTQLLGDLGAQVVKIEKPGVGDDARAWGPPFLDGESLWFTSVNRNKSSLSLDIASESGHEVFGRLVAKAHVVIVNQVLRAQRKLRIDYETLRVFNPTLIHVSVTGFGLKGRRANLPCYDLIAEGYSGIMDLTGEAESAPQKVGSPAADLLAGSDAALATVAALYRLQRDGRGCQVDVSMLESMTRFLAPRISPYLGSGEVPRRSGGRDSVIAIYQVFETADLPMTLGLGSDAIWARFWRAVDRAEFGANEAYATNASRRERRAEIVVEIAGILKTRPRADWLMRFEQAAVPAGPIYRIDEVTADAELVESGFFYAAERPGAAQGPGAPVPQIGLGIRFDGRSETCATAPPRLGENTESVLKDWLGVSDQEIAGLRSERAI